MTLSSRCPYLVHSHKFLRCVCCVLAQWYEFDIGWFSGFIPERGLESVKIVRSDSHKLPAPAQVLVKLVLQVYEGLVRLGSEGDIAQNSAGD